MTYKFNNVYLNSSFTSAGDIEFDGPISSYIDHLFKDKDKSFEALEIQMLKNTIDMLLEKNNLKDTDIKIAIGGELSNQLATTSYTFRTLNIPLIGVYSACSTICLSIGLAALLCKDNDKILCFTSSYNQSAERQFRNPVEYGGSKDDTQTFTATGAACCILSNIYSSIRINAFTVGNVIDFEFNNPNDFGRAMAPAAIETLFKHFKNTNTSPKDYDLILTGDLSNEGHKIVKDELYKKYGYNQNYNDCGLILYDIDSQNVYSGGSGPATSALVFLSYVKKLLEEKRLKRVLLCATGALMNTTMLNQHESIPSIAHIIELERTI